MVEEKKKEERNGLLKKALDALKDVGDAIKKSVDEPTEPTEPEPTEPEPTEPEPTEPEPTEPTELTQKDMKSIIKRIDVLEQKEYKQEKEITTLKKENKILKEDNKELKKDKMDKTHKNLVTKALDISKEIRDEKVVDEESLIKAVRKSYEIPDETDVEDSDIANYIKGLEIAKTKIPAGLAPLTVDSTLHKEQTDTQEKIKQHRERMAKHGKQ